MPSRLFDEGQHNPPGHELAGTRSGRVAHLPDPRAVPPMPEFPWLRELNRAGGASAMADDKTIVGGH